MKVIFRLWVSSQYFEKLEHNSIIQKGTGLIYVRMSGGTSNMCIAQRVNDLELSGTCKSCGTQSLT